MPPEDAPNFPESQAVQNDVPVIEVYRPAAQGEQVAAAAPLYDPAGHATQSEDPEIEE